MKRIRLRIRSLIYSIILTMIPISMKADPTEHWITVFVHGIMSIQHHLTLDNCIRFFNDNVENTSYSSTVDIMREDPFFYQGQAMQGYGMHPIDARYPTSFNIAALKAHIFEMMQKKGGILNVQNHFYTYGWSGLMSHTARYKESVPLFQALETIIANTFAPLGITPKIRILAYSHGGNLCLNLAAVRQRLYPQSPLKINELILIGTPIQLKTDHLILDPIFEKVYNLYSAKDRVQTIDIFGANHLYSNRVFTPRADFCLPEKLKQVNLKVTRCTKGVMKNPKRFAKTFDFSNKSILLGYNNLLRDASPGHGELWFFGWNPRNYRKDYPLYPIPMVTLTPLIIPYVNKLEKELYPDINNHFIADIRPQHETIIIRTPQNAREFRHIQVPFLSPEKLTELKDYILTHEPEHYSHEEYSRRILLVCQQANKMQKTMEPRKKRTTSRIARRRAYNRRKTAQ